MVDLNIEFTRGVLFVRLAGILNEVSSMDVEEKVFEIILRIGHLVLAAMWLVLTSQRKN